MDKITTLDSMLKRAYRTSVRRGTTLVDEMRELYPKMIADCASEGLDPPRIPRQIKADIER